MGSATAWVALVLATAVPIPSLNFSGVSAASVLAIATCPLWLRPVLAAKGTVGVFTLIGLMVVNGWFLVLTAPIGREFSADIMRSLVALLATSALSFAVIVWSALAWGRATVSIAYGVGGLIELSLTGVELDENAWKYSLSVPVVLIVLGVAAKVHQATWSLIAVAAIMVVSAFGSYRSLIAICAFGVTISLVLRVVQRRHGSTHPSLGSATWLVALLVVAAMALNALLTRLLLVGALGSAAQATTERQIQQTGELITGGRIEPFATLALMRHNPLGYGPGAIPDTTDSSVVLSAFQEAGVSPSLSYVNGYMLNGQFKLHSTIGDLWVNFGLAGVMFTAFILVVVARFFVACVQSSASTLLDWVLVSWLLWNTAFSPIYSNFDDVIFTLGYLVAATMRTNASSEGGEARATRDNYQLQLQR